MSSYPTRIIPPYEGNANEPGGGAKETTIIVELERLFNTALQSNFKEFNYDIDGNLDLIEVWEDSNKNLKLFTKTLTYITGDLVGVVTANLLTGSVLTATLTYFGGELSTVSKAIT
jgi:hypothetical protein